ncbi:MAG: hypothetical protein HYV29_14360 [Ignavibacteriales bacterium]|nr:hypothetical protein [Ignavibacteriales bacterium]
MKPFVQRWINIVIDLKKNSHLKYCIAFTTVLIATGCNEDPPTSNKPFTPSYTQSLIDGDVIWAINSQFAAIYNQNLAGKPTGNKNLTASGPLGGTVTITGVTSYASNNGITTVNLKYVLTNSRSISTSGNVSVDLTLTGEATYTGSWSSSGYTASNIQSGYLQMSGTAKRTGYTTPPAIVEATSVSITTSSSDGHGSISGTIGNRSATWSW